MKKVLASERLLIEELMPQAKRAKETSKGLALGALIKMIRNQIGMSQKNLSQRAKIPQSTISRIEKGGRDASVSVLQKILKALFCDLVLIPLLSEPIDMIRRKQARKQAEAHVRYLKGTMNLEKQEPDSRFLEKLIQQEEERLLRGSDSTLWEERDSRAP